MAERFLYYLDLGGGRRAELFEPTDRNVELHVDGIQGMMLSGSTVKLNFFTRGYTEDLKTEIERREVVCRMVMGVETFLSIAGYFRDRADEMRKVVSLEIDTSDAEKKPHET